MTLLFLGFLGGLFHFADSEVHRFEHSAAGELSSKLQGDAREVTVRADVGPEALWGDVAEVWINASHFSTPGLPLFTEPKRSHRGLVRMLHLDLQDFSLAGLHVGRLSADIPDCRFDFSLAVRRREFRLSESGHGTGEVVVSEKDLEQFILSKYSEIKRAQVKIDKDKVIVEGYGEFLIFKTNFTIIAKLVAEDGSKLVLAHARILLDGVLADDSTRNILLFTLNPVVDLNKDLALFGAIKVEHLILRDGLLTASGPTVIPDLPQPQRPP